MKRVSPLVELWLDPVKDLSVSHFRGLSACSSRERTVEETSQVVSFLSSTLAERFRSLHFVRTRDPDFYLELVRESSMSKRKKSPSGVSRKSIVKMGFQSQVGTAFTASRAGLSLKRGYSNDRVNLDRSG